MTARGVEICKVTLHVGAGTFEPVMTENVTEHPMHFERFEIGAQAAGAIEAARIDPARRVVAVGTTSVRTLEACMKQHGRICSASGQTDLFIYPGFQFQAVRAMITNFHSAGLDTHHAGRGLVRARAHPGRLRRSYRTALPLL